MEIVLLYSAKQVRIVFWRFDLSKWIQDSEQPWNVKFKLTSKRGQMLSWRRYVVGLWEAINCSRKSRYAPEPSGISFLISFWSSRVAMMLPSMLVDMAGDEFPRTRKRKSSSLAWTRSTVDSEELLTRSESALAPWGMFWRGMGRVHTTSTRHKCETLGSLKCAITKEWKRIDEDKQLLRKLMISIPRRCEAVIQSRGEQIRWNFQRLVRYILSPKPVIFINISLL